MQDPRPAQADRPAERRANGPWTSALRVPLSMEAGAAPHKGGPRVSNADIP